MLALADAAMGDQTTVQVIVPEVRYIHVDSLPTLSTPLTQKL